MFGSDVSVLHEFREGNMTEDQRRALPAFLPGIENAIQAALKAVGDHDLTPANGAEAETALWRQQLERLGDRVCGLPVQADRPAPVIAELDAALQGSEEEVRNYLEGVEDLRRRLSLWCGTPADSTCAHRA